MQITAIPRLIDVGSTPGNKRIVNDGPEALYYVDTQPSRETPINSYDGSLNPGDQLDISTPKWVRTETGSANLTLVDLGPIPDPALSRSGISGFTADTFYNQGTLIINGGSTYYATVAFTSETVFNPADWTLLPVTTDDAIPTAEKGQANGVATLNGSGKIPAAQIDSSPPTLTAVFSVPGYLAVGAGTIPYPLPDCTIVGVEAVVGGAPTGQPVLVDLNRNGTTLNTTQAHRPSIPAGAVNTYQTSGVVVPTVTSFAAGRLTVDVDQIGTSTGGTALHVDTRDIAAVDGTTFQVTRPAGAAENDVIVILARISTTGLSWTPPAGWTVIGSTINNGSLRAYKYYKVLGTALADPGPWTFTASGTFTGFLGIAATRTSVDFADVIDSHADGSHASSVTHTIPALTTVDDDTTELLLEILSTGRTISTPNLYERHSGFTGAGATARHQADANHAGAGVQASFDMVLSSATTGVSARIALNAATDATPQPGRDLVVVVSYIPD